ncbi:MAG: hypothetical protein KAS01_00085 [Candidatus Pacebacteria bacterium]|nr:hypothetical protein [Candidatus Paceibacterota bacterium]
MQIINTRTPNNLKYAKVYLCNENWNPLIKELEKLHEAISELDYIKNKE